MVTLVIIGYIILAFCIALPTRFLRLRSIRRLLQIRFLRHPKLH